jgi:2,3,4,5-tetrahydropyridine-2,6-dicarboxylate N-succinyltransferase
MSELQSIIEQAWEDRANLKPGSAPAKIGNAVSNVLAELDAGRIRVAEKTGGAWVVHQWIKKAVLLSFRLEDNVPMPGAATQ